MQLDMLSKIGTSSVSVFTLSFITCLAVIMLSGRAPRLAGRPEDLASVQACHRKITPRVGGLGIFVALLGSLGFAPITMTTDYALFLAAGTVLFCVGLAEDLGWHMSPRTRLAAAALASLATIIALGVWIPRFDIPGVDALAHHWFIGVPLTILLITGIANAFNMIDGVNGLAGMTAFCAACALVVISAHTGYQDMILLASMLAAGILGFLVLNYPYGWIFLGDAGAYTIGFILSWFCVAILLNAPDVTPWAMMLILFWPVADMLLAMFRRAKRNKDAMKPDRLHVHQLVMRALEIHVLGRDKRHIANPLTTLVLIPFVSLPPLLGVLFWDQTTYACLSFFGCGAIFIAAYLWSVPIIQSRSWSRRLMERSS